MARTLVLAVFAGAALGVTSMSQAQTPPLMFGDFETVSPADAAQPLGWNPFNGARRRTVGDGLIPILSSAHGGVAVVEQTPLPVGPSDFLGYSSDSLTDPNDALSPRNNPGYTFDPPNGPDLTVSGWFMIPASDPIVGHRAGLKLEFRRTENNSVYEGFEWLDIDPANPTLVPGLTAVTTPTGPGVHTNGQWMQFTRVFHQSQFTIPLWPMPPVNPDARVSILAIRFGNPYVAGARGTIFWDDMSFTQAVPCPADFDGNGQITPSDVAAFVSTWFASLTAGNLEGDFNNNGVVEPADVAAFVTVWFAALTNGC